MRTIEDQLAAGRRLGALPIHHDARTLRLVKYFHLDKLDAPPLTDTEIDQYYQPTDPLGNDQFGCCVLSAVANLIMGWSRQAGKPVTITADQVIATYKQMTGCKKPGDANDVGLDPLNVLKVWKSEGLWGHKIVAYAMLTPGDFTQARYAIHYLGGVFVALELSDTNTYGPWLQPSGPPDPNNGHMVENPRYLPDRQTAYTWAEEIDMGDQFYRLYASGFVVFSQDWLDNNGLSPDGFNAAALLSDVAVISGQPTPPPSPTPPVPGSTNWALIAIVGLGVLVAGAFVLRVMGVL